MRLPKFRIIEKPADFACGHTAPIRAQIDRLARIEVEDAAHARLLAAKARAKKMLCLRCANEQWNAVLGGEQIPQSDLRDLCAALLAQRDTDDEAGDDNRLPGPCWCPGWVGTRRGGHIDSCLQARKAIGAES